MDMPRSSGPLGAGREPSGEKRNESENRAIQL